MAIRIQCSECKKRIVIDDAFAGGACRCPFCSEIVMVPAAEGQTPSERPESPGRPESPERPAEPEGQAAPTPSKPIDPRTVPMARADRTMTYVMFAAVAVLAVAVVVGLVVVLAGDPAVKTAIGLPAGHVDEPDDYYDPPVGSDPFKTIVRGPAIAGDVSLVPPVLYIIDGGESMREVFDSAVAITSVSMSTLRPVDRFAVIISANAEIKTDAGTPPPPFELTAATPRGRTAPAAKPADDESTEPAEESADAPAFFESTTAGEVGPTKTRVNGRDMYLPGGWLAGGAQSDQAFQKWVREYQERDLAPRGQTDVLASIDAAIALKPRNIIVFTLKDLIEGGQLTSEAATVAAKAKSSGVSIIAIGLHKGSGINDQVKLGLEKFSTASGSEARNYGFDRLSEWAVEYYSRIDD